MFLNRKSCIFCRKHCIAYFHRHMECGVLKRFLKVQVTFSIKSSCKSHFFIWKKLNLIRFIKTLIKEFTSHLFRFVQYLLNQGEGFKDITNGFKQNAIKLHFDKSSEVLGQRHKVFSFPFRPLADLLP